LGGGGVVVEFTYCIPGDYDCSDDSINESVEVFNSDSYYIFEEVKFCNNSAYGSGELGTQENDYFVPHKTMHESFGQGGGLYVVFKGNCARVNMVVVSLLAFRIFPAITL